MHYRKLIYENFGNRFSDDRCNSFAFCQYFRTEMNFNLSMRPISLVCEIIQFCIGNDLAKKNRYSKILKSVKVAFYIND